MRAAVLLSHSIRVYTCTNSNEMRANIFVGVRASGMDCVLDICAARGKQQRQAFHRSTQLEFPQHPILLLSIKYARTHAARRHGGTEVVSSLIF